jgi:PAS domain S-box-containing protein
MQSTPKTIRLLCLTDAPGDSDDLASKLAIEGSDVDIALATSLGDALSHLGERRVDCLLCTHSDALQRHLTTIRTLRGEFPAVPVIVFVDSEASEYVDAVLDAGATEILQSTVASVSEPLLGRRIESVVDDQSLRSARDRTLERYETILNTAVDGIYQLDTDGTIVAVNDAAVELTGYDRAELIGSNVAMAMPDEEVRRGEQQIARALGKGIDGVQSLEMTIKTNDGREIPCETRIAVLRRGGVFEGTVGVVRDVSEQRERQRKLRERDEMLEHISENINDAVWITPPEKEEIEFISAAYEEIWGRSRKELYKNPDAFVEGVHPDDRAAVEAALERQREDPESYDEIYRVVQPDGTVRWVHDRAFGVYGDGELVRLVGVAQDITERRETQQQLAAERDMFAEGPAVVFRWNSAEGWPVEYVSENVEEAFGYTPEALESGEIPYADIVHEDDLERVTGEVAEYSESGAERFNHKPYRIVTPEGETKWVTDTTKIVRDGDTVKYYQGYLVDITERKAREQKIQQQRDELVQLDRLNGVIRDVDQALVGASSRGEIERLVCERLTSAGQYYFALALRAMPDGRLEPTAWTDVGERYVEDGFPIENATPDTSPGMRALETGEVQVVGRVSADVTEQWEKAAVDVGIESLAAVPVTYDDVEYGVIGVYASDPGAFTEQELEVLAELGETIGYATAAVERREREKALTSLHEGTRALLGTTTEQEVSDIVVDVAADVLELSGVGVFLFDSEENALRPVAATDTLIEFYGDSMVFGPGHDDSLTWDTYATGQSNVFDDIRSVEGVYNPETSGRSAYLLPLGDHGVFVAASEEVGVFDAQKRKLVGLLAATTEAALDRVAGREGIRELDEELTERTRKLDAFERVSSLLRDVAASVVSLSSRRDLEQAVCDRLVDEFAFAWVGSVPPDGTAVEPHTWTGNSEYLDVVSATVGSGEPSARAAERGDVVVVDNVTDHLQESQWARTASHQGYQSALAVPLTYGEATYGVLAVYAAEPGAFDDVLAGTLGDIGRLLGYGLSVVETKQGILADDVAELELDIATPNTFLNTVAGLAGTSVQYRETTSDSDGATRVLFELDDPPVEGILALEAEFVAVESLTHLERGDRHTFRATLNGDTVAGRLLESGGIPQRVVAGGDRTQAVVRLPVQQSVRTFLERVRESYPDTELQSKRERKQTNATDPMQFALDTELTGRQREVLVTAYESGFFESPRETTGAELADLLDVSQPTVTHHLREAQRRVFETLFGGEEPPDF